MFEIKVPEFGESIQEVQVAAWLKQPGDWIEKDEDIVELESEKASQALSSERAGVLQQIKVADGEFAHVGDILCVVEEGEKPAGTASTASTAAGGGTAVVADTPAATTEWIMPAAERVLSEYQISADAITPTGPGGRLLKEDVLNYVRTRGLKPTDSQPSQPAPAITPPKPRPQPTPEPVAVSATHSDERIEKSVPMSMIRRTISKRLVEAQQTAALLTTFNEIDMLPVKELRSKYKDAFLNKHGVKLGFMSFFAKAVVEGLKRYPAINSEVQGDRVIVKNYHDIGIAIGGGKGLVVPILRNVENMSFAVVERKIGEYAALAQANKIVPDDLKGGTFTISNGGVYGSLLSTPIVNPPQSGILGLHTIQERPIALNGEVVIRPMMYVALTYDHRIVDGKEAVGFLKTIKEVLEEPARLFLEV
ncbi:2-oxoglutarate dehydrogenase complex dihydrolipoyllysine-residue succinyltransferase [bacterium]|nr:2-oxoglutarate dehydrogenase complex dihydrolipoyllysine-residue succinyltransferase [bacterium]MDA7924964.1 2-oxoglutarate dehydrogenase complex dihydrolipoyllysine-residue succinyltransferase [Mariniblastus sp.]MDB4483971.1 2-oxoglutarate dehydrogenase complex dihydrolipoyllysine-residue succinyltransferase [bacterium]